MLTNLRLWLALMLVMGLTIALHGQGGPPAIDPGNWADQGIDIVPVTSYDKPLGLAPGAADLSFLFPYCFMVHNRSGKMIHGFLGVWTYTDRSTGKTIRTVQSAGLMFGVRAIANGSDYFFGPSASLGHVPGPTGTPLAELQKLVPPAAQALTGTMGALLFDDGSVLGPAAHELAPLVRGQIDAAKDLLADCKSNQNDRNTLEGYLRSKADIHQGRPPGSSDLGAKYYRDRQWQLASAALLDLQRGGVPLCITRLQQEVDRLPKYPVIEGGK